MTLLEIEEYAREQDSYFQPGRFFEQINFKLVNCTSFFCPYCILEDKDNYFIIYTKDYGYLILPKSEVVYVYKNNNLAYSSL